VSPSIPSIFRDARQTRSRSGFRRISNLLAGPAEKNRKQNAIVRDYDRHRALHIGS